MKYLKFPLLIMIPLFFAGCVNRYGISLHYYPDCSENYDLYGVYYKKCNELIKFKTHERKICLDCN